jgi:DNA-binding winged helix-turn-helix (wHTH) protein
VLKKGQLYFNNKKIIVEPLKLAILSHLMDSEEQVYSKEIIELINKPHLDYSHSTRIMNDVLYKINYIVRTLLKTDQDIIRVSKSTFDKRLKVYSIDKGLIVKA